MKQIRRHVTYANVMSSFAVFLILGGATAFAAVQKVGPNEIKANSIKTGKIVKEAVTAGKIKKAAVTESRIADGAVTTNKLADNAVTTGKIANDAVTGDKVKESSLGEVPTAATAANALKLDGQTSAGFVARNALLWALVEDDGTLIAGSGATASTKLAAGSYRVTFNRSVNNCVTAGASTDATGGAAPEGATAMIVATDNRLQTTNTTVDVTTTSPAGVREDPAEFDGFTLTVYC